MTVRAALLGMLALAAIEARAADEAAVRLARAQTLYSEGDGERAAAEFEAAYALSKDPKLHFNIGQAWQLAGDPRKAVRAYTRYLSDYPNAENTEDVRRLVVELTPLTFKDAKAPKDDLMPPRIRHEPKQTWPAGEAITIEATIEDHSKIYEPVLYFRVGRSGSFIRSELQPGGENKYVGLVAPMDSGEVQYFLEAFDDKGNGPARNGTPSFPHTLRVHDPTALPLAGDVPAAAAPPLPPLVVSGELGPEVEVRGTSEGRGPVAYIALAAGALAIGAGTFFGVRALGAAGEWAGAGTDAAIQDARSRAEGAALAATVSWVAGGLLAAGGGALLFFTEF